MIRNKKYFGKYFIKGHKTLHKRKKLPIILFVISLLLILDLIFIPFESRWLRFETPEASIKYSLVDFNKKNYFIDADDTVFVMRNRGNDFEYHSITKYNEKYSMCDYNCKTRSPKSQYINTENYNGVLFYKCIYNQSTNKSCCFLNYTSINNDTEVKILDDKNREIQKIPGFNKENVYVYYLILDNPQQNELLISMDNKSYSIKIS